MRRFHLAFSFLIVGGIIWLAWRNLDWRNLLSAVREAKIGMVLGMMIAWGMLLVIRPVKINLILRALVPQSSCSYASTAKANIVAIAANNLLPGRAGDLLLALILRSTASAKARYVVPAIVLERLIDLAAALIIFFCGIALTPAAPAWAADVAKLGFLALLTAIGTLVALVHQRARVFPLLERLFIRADPEWRAKWIAILEDSLDGLAIAAKSEALFGVVILTALMAMFTIASYLLGIGQCGPMDLAAATFTAGAVTLSFLIPISPGGIGVFHAVAAAALALFGVPLERGVAFAIIAHGLPFVTILVLAGLVSVNNWRKVAALLGFRGGSV